ncbi:universal stress protein [Rhodopirellula halodulae]|uniref:universal stress protein n=1 Tax=Rhodopirellula halodulae TaxID=2894198 RepID=UPI001E559B03|nr:universal stress protein [Rhodopirellula sp. JC737]MCC9656252.1 universal stress protein [Rhodopirellula sp. JC737]
MSANNKQKLTTLVGMDGSEPSRQALESFALSSIAEDCDVTLMRFMPSPPVYTVDDAVTPWIPTDIFQMQADAEEASLSRIRDEYKDRFAGCRTLLSQGHPGRGLVEQAADMNADWVLVGSVGRTAMERVFLGSTSDYVANHAACSCLVHRPSHRLDVSGQPFFSRVTIALSNNMHDSLLPQWISRLGFRGNCDIQLIHVMETHAEYDLDLLKKISAYMQEVRSVAWKQMEATREQLRMKGMDAHVTLLESPHVGQAVVEHAEKHNSDLIIVGDHDQPLLERVLLGSVSRYVVRHAKQSVLIARK